MKEKYYIGINFEDRLDRQLTMKNISDILKREGKLIEKHYDYLVSDRVVVYFYCDKTEEFLNMDTAGLKFDFIFGFPMSIANKRLILNGVVKDYVSSTEITDLIIYIENVLPEESTYKRLLADDGGVLWELFIEYEKRKKEKSKNDDFPIYLPKDTAILPSYPPILRCNCIELENDGVWKPLITIDPNKKRNIPEIKEVIFNKPATIVKWKDGTKTVVKCGKKEKFDKEKGLSMAIIKKLCNNKGNFNDIFKKWGCY